MDISALEKVGAGWTAEVFRARLQGHQEVAVNFMDWKFSDTPLTDHDNIRFDIAMLKRIAHPMAQQRTIVHCRWFYSSAHLRFATLKFKEGMSGVDGG